jgi:hypothetical protein
MDEIEHVLKDIIDDAMAMLDDCKSRTHPSSDAAGRIQMYASDLCDYVDDFYKVRSIP